VLVGRRHAGAPQGELHTQNPEPIPLSLRSRVEADNGLTGIGAAFGAPPIVEAIVEHELPAECAGENPMFSERI